MSYDLVEGPDGWAPKASPVPVSFSAGGSGPAAVIGTGDDATELDWPTRLPAPTVDGATATYVLNRTTSLVLRAMPLGFEQSLVLSEPPKATPKMRLAFGGKLKLRVADDGGFEFVRPGGKGKRVFHVPQPVMYSAKTDPDTGEHTQVAPLAAAASDAGPDAADGSVLDVSAAMAFLTDPATVYPVTIDPVIASVTKAGDTYVTQDNSLDHSADYDLRVGVSAGGNIRRSLLRFDAGTAVAGTHVTNATLNLFQVDAGSCAATGVNAYPISANWGLTTVNYGNQPAVSTAAATMGTASFAHGNETLGCANAADSINVTTMVQAWANAPATDFGMMLRAANEADPAAYKQFCSMNGGSTNCDLAANQPILSVTYNSYAGVPTGTDFAPKVIRDDGALLATSLTPSFTGVSNNLDGTSYRLEVELSHNPTYPAEGTGVFWTGTSSPTTPGASATVTPPAGTFGANDHKRYRMRATVPNALGGTDVSDWTPYVNFSFNTKVPVTPTIVCNTYTTNQWTAQAPGAVNCTLDTTSNDGTGYVWSLDNPIPTTEVVDATQSGQALTISINPTPGWHTLYAFARDTARHVSTINKISFGVSAAGGAGGGLSPADGDVTAKAVALTGSAPSPYTQVTWQWAPGTSTTWTTIPTANVTPAGSSTPIPSWPRTGTTAGNVTTFTGLNWDVATTAAALGSGNIQARPCFSSSTLPLTCAPGRTFALANQIFTADAPTAQVGPGTVSLVTGDMAISATDVSLTGLSVGRTATTLTPAAANTGATGVFGPGWTADLPGSGDGYGAYGLVDNSANGTVTLKAPDGTELTYAKQPDNSYKGTGEAADGSILTKSTTITDPTGGAGTFTGWQLKDTSGTITTWTQATTSSPWLVKWVDAAGLEGETTYARDASGRVTTILGPVPAGVTCTTSNVVKGCVALTLTYATTTTATSTTLGNVAGRVSSISWKGWDPSLATPAMNTITVASFLYDSSGRLREAWDPRITPALKTLYTYNAGGRPATITPPGRNAWTLNYDTSNRLASVQRTDPANGLATWAVAYGVPLSGTGLPDVTGATAATWGQTTSLAYAGGAVFRPSHVPAKNNTTGAYTPASTSWKYAQITYADVNGRTTNTAAYGAGAWQIDTIRYDSLGRDIWTLSAGSRAHALTPTTDTDPYVASQSDSAVRADLLASTVNYNLDGDITSELTPTRPARLSSGLTASIRSRTSYTYDEGAPAGGPFHLVTTTTTTPVALDGTSVPAADTRITKTGYAPIDGASLTGPTSGWMLYAPTNQTTQMGVNPSSADITTKIRFNSSGRTVEERLPDATGADPGTTLTTYYTNAANASVPACGGRPEWAGLICRTAPGGAASSGPAVPTVMTTYSRHLAPFVVTETSGTTIRTTTTSYDTADRLSGSAITTSNLPGSNATPATTIAYSTSSGDATTVSAGGVNLSTVVNMIGQTTSVTDADSISSTYTYDLDGNLKTLNDGKGTYTYTYDGGAGATEERRGLPTSINTGMGAAPSVYTATYGADGQFKAGALPNGTAVTRSYDTAGTPTRLTYVLPQGTSGTSNQLTFTNTFDAQGRVSVAGSIASAQTYGYDNAGRLTAVRDTTLGGCVTRTYGFDKQSDRTSLTTHNPGLGGDCQTTTAAGTVITNYDNANRISTGTGYTYDPLGRATAVPAAHLAAGAAPLDVSFYDNDLPKTLIQGVQAKNFTLDPVGRYRTAIDKASNVENRRVINHYSGNSDSPSWIATSVNSGATWTWQRYVTTFDGLAATQEDNGAVTLHIANLDGDLVATVPNQSTGPGTATSSYAETTEYGLQRVGSGPGSRYAWLGTAQRSSDALGGVVLMGVRLYNPATGQFLSADPVVGGNANAYTYPTDPINMFDLDGRWGFGKRIALAALKVFGNVAPWAFKTGCAATGLGAWLCLAVVGGLLGMVVDLLRTKIESNYWMSARSLAISFVVGAVLQIGGKYWKTFRKALLGAATRLLGTVKSVMRRVGLGGMATLVGTYAAGGLSIAAGIRWSDR